MKKLYVIIIIVAAYLCMSKGTVNAQTYPDSIPHSSVDQDSIPGMMLLASDGDEKESLFKGVIPLSPQSQALARYAEYPVSHSTGIPDISIPLYEIHVGGYTLPISVSYHSAGARVDDIPTCVGQGWTLNAGGAVFRTVMGTPDQPEDIGINKKYMDVENVRQLIMERKDDGTYGYRKLLKLLVDNDRQFDTESDRFSYNVGGLAGLFRYDINDGVFKTLDRAPHRIEFESTTEGSAFTIRDAAGNGYYLGRNEMSCLSDDGNGLEHTSAWYVERIWTPYGDINFSYLQEHRKFIYKRACITVEAGDHPEPEEEGVYATFRYGVKERKVEAEFRQDQSLVDEITWEGNRICFSYTEDSSMYGGPAILDSMTVYGSDGSLRKKIEFSYFTWYEKGKSGEGRHMLSAIKDSEAGIYSFSYYGTDTGTGLPSWRTVADPAVFSDLWGFYNGGSLHRPVLTKSIADKLKDELHSIRPEWGDRDPDLSCTQKGVLSTVTFPTGGSVKYTYELNSAMVNGKPYTAGGLRVSKVVVYNNGMTYTKNYSYLGLLTQDDPESRMICSHTLVMGGVPPYPASQYVLPWRSVSSYPVGYSYAPSNPVAYISVTETNDDGSWTEYTYDRGDLVDIAESRDFPHPSTWSPSLSDPGRRQPRLEARRVFDSGGNEVFRESFEYAKGVEETITTGVRLYSNATWTEYGYDDRFFSDIDEREMFAAFPTYPKLQAHMFYHQTTAQRVPCVPSLRTEEDMVTGFKTVTAYGYDTAFRTLQPRFATVTNSDGTSYMTEWTYHFNHSDASCSEMAKFGLNDLPVEKRVYSGHALLSRERTDYNPDIPEKLSSWSVPTGTDPATAISTLTEHERVLSFNSKGRPLSITVNGTDVTSFKWNSTGNLLESSTAPGGLKTTYTHKPLFGLASVTRPNGYRNTFNYNSAGMLQSLIDNSGIVDDYTYSISGHPTMNTNGNSVTTRRRIHPSGTYNVSSRQYYDGLGRPSVALLGGANTKGMYLYTAVSYDALGRESQTVLPSVGGTAMESKTFAQVKTLSASTYDNDAYAWSETTYDALDRPVKVTTPGNAWHSAGKAKTTQYIANASNSVRLYKAPMESMSLTTSGYYTEKTLQGVRSIDEDGNEMTVYTDRLGRKVLERRGPETSKGQNDTYFVYNALGQLRFVLSPSYQQDANLTEYAYEYRYDSHGNVVYKAIPGAGYTQYWYDRAGRLAYMQDANLRSKSLFRFFLYDKAGRQAIQGVCKVCTRDETVNFATYGGGTGGFMSTGYTLTNASRIQQATLETVSYYDDHNFATFLDTDLVTASTQSCMGLQTGSVVYNSDGTKSTTAIYYDVKGQVTESKEKTSFGTLRTTTNTYSYSGQPLKTTMTEGGVTLITENTYDAATGLLTATDVTVNGTKQRVSAVAYDSLGRVASVIRGAELKSGGKVKYTYNLHGQIKTIVGPGFFQNLYYTDGPGTKLYNGSVSAMTWMMGGNATIRGYKYAYNGYGWLTSADYGEGSSLTSNKDRYTEKSTAFTRNGAISKLQRNGLRADGTYGKVDDLSIMYSGNRATGISDAAPVVTQNGSMDYPGGNTSKVLSYNAFGALTSDAGRKITSITYDDFGNPLSTDFTGGGYIQNVYSATGERLKSVQNVMISDPGTSLTLFARSTLQYRGPVVYKDAKVDMVLFPGGYATINGTSVTFHYYTRDYLGNNRAVINGTTGAIEQTVAYYPYGAVIADLGTAPTSGQPYKFGGKELTTANGLNEYDFGARSYYPAVPGFTKPDPLCEKRPDISPYLYCANNPVNAIDPDGRSTLVTDQGDGKYKVIGGNLEDNDLNIYLNDTEGPIIGVTTSITSFYNSDKGKGEWAIGSIIDLNDPSGVEFLNGFEADTPNIANYMWNARGNHKYDFKNTNGTEQKINNIDQYRGMQIGAENGVPVITSARDIGNIAAGYMAGVKGISWNDAVTAFDAYQTYTDLSPSLKRSVIDGAITFLTGDPGGLKKIIFPLMQNKISEGMSTRNAEQYGWKKGNAVYRKSK